MNVAHELLAPKTVLVVDDAPENLSLISDMLKDRYNVKVATNGPKALRILSGPNLPELVLLDIMMPEMDGYEVLKSIKSDPRTRDIPVIFLTAKSEKIDEEKGLNLGAEDYITKPVNPHILLARLSTQLKLKAAKDFLRDNNEYLAQEVERRTLELQAIQEVTIIALASLAEARDNETGNHLMRTQFYVQALARKLKDHPRFTAHLSEEAVSTIIKSAPLHDIGRVGIPDHILLKPASLTPEEYEIMKTHTTIGVEAIENAEARLGRKVEFLKYAKEIAHYHQEKWDGSGYPNGLAGEAIPVSARLMAVADVYDALISQRVYKSSIIHESAVAVIREGRGRHFDPDIVDAFLSIQDEIKAIAARYSDGGAGGGN